MDHFSLFEAKHFAPSLILSHQPMNCRGDFYVDRLETPSNVCVLQTAGEWCCKYPPGENGSALSKDVSTCWNFCPSWQHESSDIRV